MVLKKANVLARLEILKQRANDPSEADLKGLLPLAVLELVLEYINDQQIKAAVDAIPF